MWAKVICKCAAIIAQLSLQTDQRRVESGRKREIDRHGRSRTVAGAAWTAAFQGCCPCQGKRGMSDLCFCHWCISTISLSLTIDSFPNFTMQHVQWLNVNEDKLTWIAGSHRPMFPQNDTRLFLNREFGLKISALSTVFFLRISKRKIEINAVFVQSSTSFWWSCVLMLIFLLCTHLPSYVQLIQIITAKFPNAISRAPSYFSKPWCSRCYFCA